MTFQKFLPITIMNFYRIFLFVVSIFFSCLAIAVEQKAPELPQWRGQQEGGAELSSRMIRTQAEWSAFWKSTGRAAPQALDETREAAVLITLGERPTGGFKPQVISATENGGKYVIVYSEGKPSPDSFVTQALTYPWVIAIVPKSELKIEARLQAP
jgi:hypothetical protein